MIPHRSPLFEVPGTRGDQGSREVRGPGGREPGSPGTRGREGARRREGARQVWGPGEGARQVLGTMGEGGRSGQVRGPGQTKACVSPDASRATSLVRYTLTCALSIQWESVVVL